MDEKNKRQQIIIKICCVIASFGLWLYTTNIQNPIRQYNLRDVPVELINRDVITNSKLVLMPEQDFKVTLTLKGSASEIYSIKQNQFKVVADLSNYAVVKGENKIPVQIKKRPDNVNVINSGNLWVSINLDELTQKTVPLAANVEGKPKDGYYAFPPIMKINSAFITGPSEVVKTIEKVQVKCDIKNASSDLNFNLPLRALDASGKEIVSSEVNIQPNYLDIAVPIKKIKTVGINVKTKGNISNDAVLKSISSAPDKIEIIGNEKVVSEIDSLDTEIIDLSLLKGTNDDQCKLILPKDVKVFNGNEYVKLKIVTDKIIQKNLSIDVVPKNLKEGYEINKDIPKVSIIISGPESIINNLKNEEVIANVDLDKLEPGDYNVPIKITLPQGITKVSSSPETIKVTIKKK